MICGIFGGGNPRLFHADRVPFYLFFTSMSQVLLDSTVRHSVLLLSFSKVCEIIVHLAIGYALRNSWFNFYRATACDATHGIAVAILSIRPSFCQMRVYVVL